MAANRYSDTQEIIDIQVKYKDAVVGIANIKKEIEELENWKHYMDTKDEVRNER